MLLVSRPTTSTNANELAEASQQIRATTNSPSPDAHHRPRTSGGRGATSQTHAQRDDHDTRRPRRPGTAGTVKCGTWAAFSAPSRILASLVVVAVQAEAPDRHQPEHDQREAGAETLGARDRDLGDDVLDGEVVG